MIHAFGLYKTMINSQGVGNIKMTNLIKESLTKSLRISITLINEKLS